MTCSPAIVGCGKALPQCDDPSICKAADGLLLLLFTRHTHQQENEGLGDLLLVRSNDGGLTWSEQPELIYAGRNGEPLAVGTLTALSDGRMLAPFAELSDKQASSRVRILMSDDGGKTWRVDDPQVTVPLVWWAPSGRVVEADDRTLVMPVYGAASQADLKATIYNCGLLRSSDEGKTWGDFSWIGRGDAPMIGAPASSRFSFEGPSLHRGSGQIPCSRVWQAEDYPRRRLPTLRAGFQNGFWGKGFHVCATGVFN